MNFIKALFLTEIYCYIAFLNKHYQNPPMQTSTLDCLAAKRPLPCSLCLARAGRSLDFPAPSSTPDFPALTERTPSSRMYRGPKKLKLTRNERDIATAPLIEFRNATRLYEHKQGRFLEHPQTMFLPSSIQSLLLDNLLSISSLSILQAILKSWRHCKDHSAALYQVIIEIQTQIIDARELVREDRNTASRRKRAEKRKATAIEETSAEELTDHESDSSLPEHIELPPKSARAVLKTVTNLKRPRRLARTQPSAAEVTMDYGRQYKPRERGRK